MPARRFRVPCALAVAVVVTAAGCASTPDYDAAVSDVAALDRTPADDVAPSDDAISSDVVASDAAPDCAFICMTETLPTPDGGFQQIVAYADGAVSDSAACDAPPLPIQCGV